MTETGLARDLPSLDQQISDVFERCFAATEGSVLVGGAQEPLYQPSRDTSEPHRICYREDFARSALHEAAHWCIAGAARRQLVDYGYWYEPDGRSHDQQREFERVERGPQALEWFFCLAAKLPFSLSIDNLDGAALDNFSFALGVWQQSRRYMHRGLPVRARRFQQALAEAFGGTAQPGVTELNLAVLVRQ